MHRISKFVFVSLAASFGVNAFGTSIFVFDEDQQHHAKGLILSENTAGLLLEHRMKTPDSLFLGSSDDETAECLDQFGGERSLLFGIPGRRKSPQKSLIILEGIDDHFFSLVQDSYPNIRVGSHLSMPFIDDDFLASLLELDFEATQCAIHSKNVTNGPGEFRAAVKCLSRGSFAKEAPFFSDDLLAHVDSMEYLARVNMPRAVLRVRFKVGSEGGHLVPYLKRLFQHLATAALEDNRQVTVVLSQNLPKSQQPGRVLYSRDYAEEKFLSKSLSHISEGKGSHNSRKVEQRVSVPSALVPVCYTSNVTCIEATNNCSGHGFCYNKHASKNEGASGDCFACKCVETLVRKEDGRIHRINWVGSTCQKRDVSSPFFLLMGITAMVMVAAITAIRLLFSIGQDELPTVIGAGVGAIRTQK
ncbi:hypothetical protein MAP00_003253 [Monascus purpureus]|nr:hypothetical protein MAP00_003253 [Monascus purpureus]